ncbi:antibiotic biosynthesis monooxygenase [Rhodobacteraceae bacterium NNCM2]|nr:antibiotic biosynthesis monooxygenase [Coraliihabitans acroporae]
MTELSLFAKITPKPEHLDRARSAIEGILALTRQEPGCRHFSLHRGEPGDGSLYLYERWDDDAALESHYAQDYTKAVFAAYEGWLACPVEITRMARID